MSVSKKRIVVKVGTSTLTHETGKLNIRKTEDLCRVLSDLKNAGHEIILVSSGAIGRAVETQKAKKAVDEERILQGKPTLKEEEQTRKEEIKEAKKQAQEDKKEANKTYLLAIIISVS